MYVCIYVCIYNRDGHLLQGEGGSPEPLDFGLGPLVLRENTSSHNVKNIFVAVLAPRPKTLMSIPVCVGGGGGGVCV